MLPMPDSIGGVRWKFGCLPYEQVKDPIEDGTLVEVLTGWRQTFEGYHLYYPHRRHPLPAFSLLVETLRWRR